MLIKFYEETKMDSSDRTCLYCAACGNVCGDIYHCIIGKTVRQYHVFRLPCMHGVCTGFSVYHDKAVFVYDEKKRGRNNTL